MDDDGRRVAVLTTIRTVVTTGSTNADVIALARAGAEEGLWLRAEAQSSGRGRQGRDWASPPGNLYASTLVRLRPSDPPPATLALVAAVALDAAVRVWLDDRIPLKIKWPNDLLIGAAKLSGILLERADDAVVIGFGVNLAFHPDLPDRPTTSLAAHGAVVGAGDFLEALAEGFSRWLGKWRGEGLAPIRSRWMERAHAPGTALDVRLPDGSTQHGLFDRLDADGALILRLADGTTRVIHAADVFLL
ncbi:biotin--[acetyl-CoA-carboxylase] ligase [Sphingomonas sp. AR_OL41]|uniref:biotin--[acetyl-CoA-carboxylase] ligase n=1 Tax=Sphingomonas sp. AR_OL41 TaxID=3042729 RepID=UPI002480B932|nr:biotin--[acetyl-CoA-carboxylase] ligase [Sphingomonas sp. AR_OL41]MDH7970570.1 biotin--[acetyl-CoA-carboxylase] ligase [Sphingomonas sp. AR_OL41]